MSSFNGYDILLRLKGDASGVKVAAGEAAGALRQIEEAAARMNAMVARAQSSTRGSNGLDPSTGLPLGGSSSAQQAAAKAAQESADAQVEAVMEVEQARRDAANAAALAESKVRSLDEQTTAAVEAAKARQVAAIQRAAEARARELYGGYRKAGYGEAEAGALAQTDLAREMGEIATKAEEIGHKSEEGVHGVRGLSQALGLISPEAAELVRGLHDAQEGMSFLGQSGASGFIATAVGVGAVIGLITLLNEKIKQATEAYKAFYEQQQRIKDATTEVQKTVSGELGKRGMGSEAAFNTATNIARTLEDQGFDKAAAATAAAASVDASGKRTMDNATIELLAAGVQRGDVDLGGKNDRERKRNLNKALRQIDRNKASYQGSAEAFTRVRSRQVEDARRGDLGALKEYAKSRGATDQEAEEYAKAYKEQVDTGSIGYESTGNIYGDFYKTLKEGAFMDLGLETEAARRQRVVKDLGAPNPAASYRAESPGGNVTINQSFNAPSYHGARVPGTQRRASKGVSISRK